MSRAVDLAVIGGGLGATALLCALARRAGAAGREVAVVDPAGHVPATLAYHRARAEHLLNVRAGAMGLDPTDPEDFARWAQSRPEAFLPRRLYGSYLDARMAGVRAAFLRAGGGVRTVQAWAEAVLPYPGGYRVVDAHGATLADARRVVLATGPAPAQPLGPAHQRIASGPWDDSLERLAPFTHEGRVLIVGSGLSAVDAALSLARMGASHGVVLVADHNRLPQPHTALPAPTQPVPPAVREAATPLAFVRAMRAFAKSCADWRIAIDAVRPHTAQIWARFPAGARRGLLLRRGWAWNRLRHRMAPAAANEIAALIETGRLSLCAGRVTQVSPDAAGVRLRLAGGGEIGAACIVDARGPDPTFAGAPLISRLVRDGLAAASPTGCGISADAEWTLHRGEAGARLFALGAPLTGERLETTAAPEICQQADEIAQLLLSR